MNKTKHLIRAFSLALMALPLSAMAQETVDVQCLVIEQNGTKVAGFALSRLPELSFRADTLVVSLADDGIEVPMSGLTYSFQTLSVPTGINDVPTIDNGNGSNFAFSQGKIMGLKAGARVEVYTANGLKVKEYQASNDGTVELRLGNLPVGVYIIKTPARSIKIINK